MGGINQDVIGQLQQLVMQGIVQQSGELLRRVRLGEVGPPDIADEERISGEYCPRPLGLFFVRDDQTDALWRVARGLEPLDAELANRQLKAVRDVHMRK